MTPEIGHFAQIIAFVIAIVLSIVPMVGAFTSKRLWMQTARPLAVALFVFVGLSFLALVHAFVNDDFSVRVVANHSNLLLPTLFKVTAVWGGHEGSLLLWIWILSFWTMAVSVFSRALPLDIVARVLAVMGMIAVGFLAFSLFTSNTFERMLPQIPADGRDLNPLLQDIAMVIHPPMLYAGYVGFSVAFAFAIAALLSGRLDTAWARWSRPWTNVAWAMLTAGIALGSWWAYYELGWGGWWFWDPVENASFMPWLAGTALIHSLAVTEKRGVFKSWTVLLAIFTFSLSLLGTFLVRSGVLTSVHAFAADPGRGMFILVFLAIVVGGSLTLYAFRAPTVASRVKFELVSREASLLLNNVVLLVVTLAILLCTLFPMLADALKLGKYSVGPPIFNMVFVPLMAILLAFMGVGPLLRWKRTDPGYLRRQLLSSGVASLIIGMLFPFVYAGQFNPAIVIAVTLCVWLVLALLVDMRNKIRNAPSLFCGLKRLSPSYYGMVLAHLGIAVSAMGICIDSHYRDERDIRMVQGDVYEAAGYRFVFEGVRSIRGPNYSAQEGRISVTDEDGGSFVLAPQKRRYASGGNMMTEAGIDAGLFRDVYVALGEALPDEAWSVRIHYKPYVRWIWFGAGLMVIGGLLTVWDKRYRKVSKTSAAMA
jgi:cytochrome c-type biogenesis protein CcmF